MLKKFKKTKIDNKIHEIGNSIINLYRLKQMYDELLKREEYIKTTYGELLTKTEIYLENLQLDVDKLNNNTKGEYEKKLQEIEKEIRYIKRHLWSNDIAYV